MILLVWYVRDKTLFYHSKKSLGADRHRETFFKICVPYISDKPLKNTETVSGKFLKEPFLVAASEIITFIYQALFKVSFRFSFFFLFVSSQCIHFFNISLFLTFSLCQPLLKKSMEDKSLNFKVYNVINWLNKNLDILFDSLRRKKVWYSNLVNW